MKICLSCAARYESCLTYCPKCGHAPEKIGGFEAYAPELAKEGSGYQGHYFAELVRLENENFWFRSRNELLLWVLRTYGQEFHSFLEVGCGTGYVLSGVATTFPQVKLSGSEIFTAGLEVAASRVPDATLLQMDARKIPFDEEFDVIGAFDVLEHIEDDELVLNQIYVALKPKGIFLATVPQHKWLWSATDESSCHVRRYDAAELDRKLKKSGYEVVRSTSFVSLLLPVMMLSRFFMKQSKSHKEDAFMDELKINPWLNSFFLFVLRLEQMALRRGINFPAGGSRLVVARKPEQDSK